MALPPLPILAICALIVFDIIQSVIGVIGWLLFAALPGGNGGASSGFGAVALLFVALMLAQIASIAGLFLARRWAVIAGAASFRLSILGSIVPASFWPVLSIIPIALFLICTLPYWERMTWRFP